MDIEKSLKYLLYARKSDEAKERQVLSIRDQIAECKAHADRENLNIFHIFEESKSAYKPNKRPIFIQMLDLIKAGKADAILTWRPNRLSRNPEEGGKVMQLLQDGILQEIRTAAGERYTQNSDHLILHMHFGMANSYSRKLSKDVKRGLKHKAMRGEYPRPAPIGFEGYGERGQRNIRPHPVEAPLIRKAFELAAKGIHSLNTIRQKLHKAGLRTKKSKKISKSHMQSILIRPTYYGYFYHNDKLYEGNYEPIITKQLFDRVQEALKDRSKPKKNTHKHPYNGLLKCFYCGCAITTTVKEKYYKGTDRTAIYTYHHCTGRRGDCPQPYWTSDKLEKELTGWLEKITVDKDVWELGIKLLKEKHKEETYKAQLGRRSLQAEAEAVQDKLNSLIDMRADGELTKKEFMKQKEAVLQEKARVKSLLQDNEDSSQNWLELAEDFLETAYQAKEIMESDNLEEKRELLLKTGRNLVLKEEKLVFTFRKPFDVLLKPAYRTDVLRG